MNEYELWVESSRCYEMLKTMNDMNDSGSWAQDFRCYKQLTTIDEMNDLRLIALGFSFSQ